MGKLEDPFGKRESGASLEETAWDAGFLFMGSRPRLVNPLIVCAFKSF